MAVDGLNRAGEGAGSARTDAPSSSDKAHSRRREIKADADAASRGADRVEVGQFDEVVNRYRANAERLQRMVEGRRKLIDAVRELMNAGALESSEAARRAADGILRRGA
jgi:hypothetical protein